MQKIILHTSTPHSYLTLNYLSYLLQIFHFLSLKKKNQMYKTCVNIAMVGGSGGCPQSYVGKCEQLAEWERRL